MADNSVVNIAAAQFSARPLDVRANVATVADLIREAADRGAKLVVFPELALTGYALASIAADPEELAVRPGDTRLEPVAGACEETGTAAVVNCAARDPRAGALTITSFVVGPDRRPLAQYDKRHLYRDEKGLFTAGTASGIFELDGVRFGLCVCYDAHFPERAREAAAAGCQVYLASSLYGTGGGEQERARIYPALARESGMHVLLANHVGPAGPWTGCGRSAVWAPDGSVAAEAPAGGCGVVAADLAVTREGRARGERGPHDVG